MTQWIQIAGQAPLAAWRRLTEAVIRSVPTGTSRQPLLARTAQDEQGHAQLQRLLQTYDHLTLAQLHYVNLESLIIRHYGDKRATLRRVRRIATDVLVEELQGDETFMFDRQHGLTVFFPSLSRKAGRLRLATLSDKIFRRVCKELPKLRGLAPRMAAEGCRRERVFRHYPGLATVTPRTTPPARRRPVRPEAPPDRAAAPPPPAPWESIVAQGPGLSGTLAVDYGPIWRVDRDYIVGRTPRVVLNDLPLGHRQLRRLTAAQRAEFDAYLLACSVKRLVNALEQGAPELEIVPLAFASIDRDPHRGLVFGLLNTVPEKVRHYLVCDVVDPLGGASRQRLAEPLQRLRGMCRGLAVRVNVEESELNAWRALGANVASVDLEDEVLDGHDVHRALPTFAERAQAAGLTAAVAGLRSRAEAVAAIAAGVSYISGRPLDALIPDTPGLAPFSLMELYRLG